MLRYRLAALGPHPNRSMWPWTHLTESNTKLFPKQDGSILEVFHKKKLRGNCVPWGWGVASLIILSAGLNQENLSIFSWYQQNYQLLCIFRLSRSMKRIPRVLGLWAVRGGAGAAFSYWWHSSFPTRWAYKSTCRDRHTPLGGLRARP